MIKSEQGACHIEGRRIDIIFELNHIFDICLRDNPEILVGTISAWSDKISDRTDDLDSVKLGIATHASDDYVSMCAGKGIDYDDDLQ